MENPMCSCGSGQETTARKQISKNWKIHIPFLLRYEILKGKDCLNAGD